MNDTQLEILILRGQINALRHVYANFRYEDAEDLVGQIEVFWNELEDIKERLLLDEVYKKAPNYEALVKERLS